MPKVKKKKKRTGDWCHGSNLGDMGSIDCRTVLRVRMVFSCLYHTEEAVEKTDLILGEKTEWEIRIYNSLATADGGSDSERGPGCRSTGHCEKRDI